MHPGLNHSLAFFSPPLMKTPVHSCARITVTSSKVRKEIPAITRTTEIFLNSTAILMSVLSSIDHSWLFVYSTICLSNTSVLSHDSSLETKNDYPTTECDKLLANHIYSSQNFLLAVSFRHPFLGTGFMFYTVQCRSSFLELTTGVTGLERTERAIQRG